MAKWSKAPSYQELHSDGHWFKSMSGKLFFYSFPIQFHQNFIYRNKKNFWINKNFVKSEKTASAKLCGSF